MKKKEEKEKKKELGKGETNGDEERNREDGMKDRKSVDLRGIRV